MSDNNECFANYEVNPKPPCKVPFKVHTNTITGGCKPDRATEGDLIWVRKILPNINKTIVFPCTINHGLFQTTACHMVEDMIYTLDKDCNLVSKLIQEPIELPEYQNTQYKLLRHTMGVVFSFTHSITSDENPLVTVGVSAAAPETGVYQFAGALTHTFSSYADACSIVNSARAQVVIYVYVGTSLKGTFYSNKGHNNNMSEHIRVVSSYGLDINLIKGEKVEFKVDYIKHAGARCVVNHINRGQGVNYELEEI